MLVLEIIYNIWTGGIIIFSLNMISTFAFSKKKWRWKQVFATMWFTLIWPLALFSSEGRPLLFGKIEKL